MTLLESEHVAIIKKRFTPLHSSNCNTSNSSISTLSTTQTLPSSNNVSISLVLSDVSSSYSGCSSNFDTENINEIKITKNSIKPADDRHVHVKRSSSLDREALNRFKYFKTLCSKQYLTGSNKNLINSNENLLKKQTKTCISKSVVISSTEQLRKHFEDLSNQEQNLKESYLSCANKIKHLINDKLNNKIINKNVTEIVEVKTNTVTKSPKILSFIPKIQSSIEKINYNMNKIESDCESSGSDYDSDLEFDNDFKSNDTFQGLTRQNRMTFFDGSNIKPKVELDDLYTANLPLLPNKFTQNVLYNQNSQQNKLKNETELASHVNADMLSVIAEEEVEIVTQIISPSNTQIEKELIVVEVPQSNNSKTLTDNNKKSRIPIQKISEMKTTKVKVTTVPSKLPISKTPSKSTSNIPQSIVKTTSKSIKSVKCDNTIVSKDVNTLDKNKKVTSIINNQQKKSEIPKIIDLKKSCIPKKVPSLNLVKTDIKSSNTNNKTVLKKSSLLIDKKSHASSLVNKNQVKQLS